MKSVRPLKIVMLGLVSCCATTVLPTMVRADTIDAYETTGKTGSEVSDAATTVDTGVTGVNLSRSTGLVASGATNNFGASGFNVAGRYFQFGFNLSTGTVVTLSDLLIATKSSSTGPGTIDINYSVDGGAFQTLAVVDQTSTNYINADYKFATPTVVTSSFLVEVTPANLTAANGSPITSAGTFRVGDYSTGSPLVYSPISLLGTDSAAITAVPLPSSMSATAACLSLVGASVVVRKRRLV